MNLATVFYCGSNYNVVTEEYAARNKLKPGRVSHHHLWLMKREGYCWDQGWRQTIPGRGSSAVNLQQQNASQRHRHQLMLTNHSHPDSTAATERQHVRCVHWNGLHCHESEAKADKPENNPQIVAVWRSFIWTQEEGASYRTGVGSHVCAVQKLALRTHIPGFGWRQQTAIAYWYPVIPYCM
jgi:hypothetical protein